VRTNPLRAEKISFDRVDGGRNLGRHFGHGRVGKKEVKKPIREKILQGEFYYLIRDASSPAL